MKTKKLVISENTQYKRMITNIHRSIGKEGISDVILHGAACGFSGFVYTSDTTKFFLKHKKNIMDLMFELAENTGCHPYEMVKSFRCLKEVSFSEKEFYDAV